MKKTIVVLLFMASLGLFSVLVAGEVYVSPHGSDRNAGTKEAPYLTLNRAIKQAREWRRLNRPEAAGGICICLEDGVYAQSAPLFIRPEDSGTPDSPTLIRAVENAHPVISGGVAVTGWKKGCDDPRITKELRSKIWVAKAPSFGNRIVETRQMWVDGNKAQRAAQFPDGVMERMIDFNPEEQTIIIPASQIGNLLNARRLEMIVHQRWAIAILRVKSIDVRGEQAVIRFHEPESHLEFAHPWRERQLFLLPDECSGTAGPTRRVVSGISVGDNLLLSPLGRRYGDCRSDRSCSGNIDDCRRHIGTPGAAYSSGRNHLCPYFMDASFLSGTCHFARRFSSAGCL